MSAIYDYEQRLVRYRRSIKTLKNGELALKFLDHLGALGLSTARVAKYASHIPVLLRVIDFDLKEAAREDVERVVAWINSRPHKEWTKHDKKLTLRKLVQYAKCGRCDRETPLPPEVSWIRLTVKEKDARTTPESLLTPEDFKAIVNATRNRRDRAMVYVLFEAALRPGELLTMRVDSVEFKDDYCLITGNGKTGIKRIPLVVSCRPLLEWLQEHPERANPNAPLWCSLATNYDGSRLSYKHFRLLIKRLARLAGLKKDVWPYLYRHTRLAAMAKVFTEPRLEQFAGWTYGSKMTRRYVHFSARDLEDAMLELHGIKEPDKNGGLARIVECPRCRNSNPSSEVRCSFCGFILDRRLAEEMDQRTAERDMELQSRLQKLEQTITSLLNGQTESRIAQ
jgi:integrase